MPPTPCSLTSFEGKTSSDDGNEEVEEDEEEEEVERKGGEQGRDFIKLLPYLHYDLSQVDYDNHFAFCNCFPGRKSDHHKNKKFRELSEKMLYQGETILYIVMVLVT
ncbi:Hypothetical predicted protein [Octopus vulgaris]|uniref:Uncharacterized protein n=1 Tax=Octopus vulgaris TaxID=6645 RepID=A0AA36BPT3_OCTVU|nr:Hypothetical predicted protein [Octopus vulgaris]